MKIVKLNGSLLRLLPGSTWHQFGQGVLFFTQQRLRNNHSNTILLFPFYENDIYKMVEIKKSLISSPESNQYLNLKCTILYSFMQLYLSIWRVCYILCVWAERIKLRLKWWHTVFFWLGFICDTIGTTAMSNLSGSLFRLTFHGITGNIAILLMLFHAIWATIVLLRKNEIMILKFHRFSIIVWIIWLIPMISGMVFGATR